MATVKKLEINSSERGGTLPTSPHGRWTATWEGLPCPHGGAWSLPGLLPPRVPFPWCDFTAPSPPHAPEPVNQSGVVSGFGGPEAALLMDRRLLEGAAGRALGTRGTRWVCVG